jgi:hypothetical protein
MDEVCLSPTKGNFSRSTTALTPELLAAERAASARNTSLGFSARILICKDLAHCSMYLLSNILFTINVDRVAKGPVRLTKRLTTWCRSEGIAKLPNGTRGKERGRLTDFGCFVMILLNECKRFC